MRDSPTNRSTIRKSAVTLVIGLLAGTMTFGWWIFALFVASHLQDNDSRWVGNLILGLFATPLVVGPATAAYLALWRRSRPAGVAVVVGIALAGFVFLGSVVEPLSEGLS